jgi:hypothetical protein
LHLISMTREQVIWQNLVLRVSRIVVRVAIDLVTLDLNIPIVMWLTVLLLSWLP